MTKFYLNEQKLTEISEEMWDFVNNICDFNETICIHMCDTSLKTKNINSDATCELNIKSGRFMRNIAIAKITTDEHNMIKSKIPVQDIIPVTAMMIIILASVDLIHDGLTDNDKEVISHIETLIRTHADVESDGSIFTAKSHTLIGNMRLPSFGMVDAGLYLLWCESKTKYLIHNRREPENQYEIQTNDDQCCM